MYSNNSINTITEVTTSQSREVLLRLRLRQQEVNPESAPQVLDTSNLEMAARLNELPRLSAEVYTNVVRPSRVATFSPAAAGNSEVLPKPEPVSSFDENHSLAIPISDAAPSFLVQDTFLRGSETRERIIPLPADVLTVEQAPSFINNFLGCLLPIPEEAIIDLSPVLAEETRIIINSIRQDLLSNLNDSTSQSAMVKFEAFRALQSKIYEDSQSYKLGSPIPQIRYYTLWKFIIFKIFSLFSVENIALFIKYLSSSNITLGSCACLLLLYILRPLFLTYLDVRFWRNSFYNVRILLLRVLLDLQQVRLTPIPRIRLSQFDIRARFQRGFDLYATNANVSLNLVREHTVLNYEQTLEDIRQYRLERRGILLQDVANNSSSSLVIADCASNELETSHDEIRREVEAKLSWGFLRYFRRGAVIGILSGSLAILVNSSVRSKLYDLFLEILKRSLGNTPTPVSTGGGVTTIPTTTIPTGEVARVSNYFDFPSIEFILKAIEEGFLMFF